MVNSGPLTAEVSSGVFGTPAPANFNGFRVLAALLHSTYSNGRQPNVTALNRGRQLYSAGRPSGWALAHILVSYVFCIRHISSQAAVIAAVTDGCQPLLLLLLKAKFRHPVQLASRSQTSLRPNSITLSSLRPALDQVCNQLASWLQAGQRNEIWSRTGVRLATSKIT